MKDPFTNPPRRMRLRARMYTGLSGMLVLMAVVLFVVLRQQSVVRQNYRILDHAVGIEERLVACRQDERDYLLQRPDSTPDSMYVGLDRLVDLTRVLVAEAGTGVFRSRVAALLDAVLSYSATLKLLAAQNHLGTTLRDQGLLIDRVDDHAARCFQFLNDVRAGVVSEIGRVSAATRQANLIAVAGGLFIAIMLAFLLTRDVVGPIEYLVSLADRVRTADIQDIDVMLADMDIRRFRSAESLSLAHAFQRMVSTLRRSVWSERGMMDSDHLALIVLAERALGSAGRGIMEKARARAGLESLADVDGENLPRFLEALHIEAGPLLSEETDELLAEAMRTLTADAEQR